MRQRRARVKSKNNFREELCRSWWILLFTLIVYTAYSRAIVPIQDTYDTLMTSYNSLLHKRELLMERIDHLQQIVDSQDDPGLIEQKLKKTLHVVPDGEIKIIFPISED